MEIPAIIDQSSKAAANQPLYENSSYQEEKYRWVIVALTGLLLLLNGLANNAITPLEHKMTVIYGVSSTKVSISVILSFIVFCLVNFPANMIMDKKGLRISFLIGTSLYFLGTFCYVLINKSYNFMILGTFFTGVGQPFLINSPAKVAAYWFFPKNVTIELSRERQPLQLWSVSTCSGQESAFLFLRQWSANKVQKNKPARKSAISTQVILSLLGLA